MLCPIWSLQVSSRQRHQNNFLDVRHHSAQLHSIILGCFKMFCCIRSKGPPHGILPTGKITPTLCLVSRLRRCAQKLWKAHYTSAKKRKEKWKSRHGVKWEPRIPFPIYLVAYLGFPCMVWPVRWPVEYSLLLLTRQTYGPALAIGQQDTLFLPLRTSLNSGLKIWR